MNALTSDLVGDRPERVEVLGRLLTGGRAEQHHPVHGRRAAGRHPDGHVAAHRLGHDVDALDAEVVDDVEDVVGTVVHRHGVGGRGACSLAAEVGADHSEPSSRGRDKFVEHRVIEEQRVQADNDRTVSLARIGHEQFGGHGRDSASHL